MPKNPETYDPPDGAKFSLTELIRWSLGKYVEIKEVKPRPEMGKAKNDN